jgi:hypothetical protein
MDLDTQEIMAATVRANKLGSLNNMIVFLNKSEGDYSDYINFASKGKRRDGIPGTSGSLEGTIHDAYHGITGGGGHMTRTSVAAFDPIFWIHHW